MSAPPALAQPARLSVWQHTWRLALAAVLGLILWGSTVASASSEGQEAQAFLDLAVGVLALVIVYWHRRYPRAIAVITGTLGAVSSMALGPASLALISLATRRRWREMGLMFAISLAGGVVYDAIYPWTNEDIPWWALHLITVLAFSVQVAIGFYIGARRDLLSSLQDRAETAEREQALRVVQARVNERARIAREMHDVLAHRISLVAMHAGALAYRDDLTHEQTAEAAGIVRDNAHRALADLRDVLGVLRDTDAPADDDSRPQPTLASLDELIRESELAGTPVRLHQEVADLGTVPETMARNAYRILQESLTNARKHAPGELVDVTLAGEPGGRLDLRVRNAIGRPGPAANGQQALPSSGMGLMGLTERALLSGGELTYGPTSKGAYVVHAWLPWAT